MAVVRRGNPGGLCDSVPGCPLGNMHADAAEAVEGW